MEKVFMISNEDLQKAMIDAYKNGYFVEEFCQKFPEDAKKMLDMMEKFADDNEF